jgi:hypothetical protein
MGTGWLTCIPAVLLPHSPCRSTTANAPANRQMPIASVVMCKRKKKEKPVQIDIIYREIKLFTTTNNLKEIDYATNF